LIVRLNAAVDFLERAAERRGDADSSMRLALAEPDLAARNG
jgi:hypothetical protein